MENVRAYAFRKASCFALYPSSALHPTTAHMTNLAASSYSPAVIDPRRFLSSSIPAFRQNGGTKASPPWRAIS